MAGADDVASAGESSKQLSGAGEQSGHQWRFKSNLSYGLGEHCAWAQETANAEGGAKRIGTESNNTYLPGLACTAQGFPEPQPALGAAEPDPSEEASGSDKRASSSAASSAGGSTELGVCRQAGGEEETPLSLLLTEAEACHKLGCYKACAVLYGHISSRYRNLLSPEEGQASAQQQSRFSHNLPTRTSCAALHC